MSTDISAEGPSTDNEQLESVGSRKRKFEDDGCQVVAITVHCANYLPDIKSMSRVREAKYYASLVEINSKESLGRISAKRSCGKCVNWNETFKKITVGPSSHGLELRCFAERAIGVSDISVGTYKLSPKFLSSLSGKGSQPRRFSLIPFATMGRRISLSVSITVEPQSQAPDLPKKIKHTTVTVSLLKDPKSLSDLEHNGFVPSIMEGTSPSQSMPVTSDNAVESEDEARNVVHGAEDLVQGMHQLAPRVVSVAGFLQSSPDKIGQITDAYNTWGMVLDRLQVIVDIVDNIADVHPYAKMAWSAVSVIPKALLKQVNNDQVVESLLLAMKDALDLAEIAKPTSDIRQRESKQAKALVELLRHICECGYFIQKYAKDVQYRIRLLKNIFKSPDKVIEQYKNTLSDLRGKVLGIATVKTQAAVDEMKAQFGRFSSILEEIRIRTDGGCSRENHIDLSKIIPLKTGSHFLRGEGCLSDTRKRLLEYITNWVIEPTSKHTLVLFGRAGTGKSCIAHEIARRFKDMNRLAASFFFVRSDPANANFLFTTIAHLLADQFPSFKSALEKVIKSESGLDWSTLDYETLFWILFQHPLKDVDLEGPVFIVIDALDQSGDVSRYVKGLHHFLAERIPSLPDNFRILITSRREDPIEKAFASARSVHTIDIEDPEFGSTDDDIRTYFTKYLPNANDHWDSLVQEAKGRFRWAVVACEYISSPPGDQTVVQRIQSLLKRAQNNTGSIALDSTYPTTLVPRPNVTGNVYTQLWSNTLVEQPCAVSEPLTLRVVADLLHRVSLENVDELYVSTELIKYFAILLSMAPRLSHSPALPTLPGVQTNSSQLILPASSHHPRRQMSVIFCNDKKPTRTSSVHSFNRDVGTSRSHSDLSLSDLVVLSTINQYISSGSIGNAARMQETSVPQGCLIVEQPHDNTAPDNSPDDGQTNGHQSLTTTIALSSASKPERASSSSFVNLFGLCKVAVEKGSEGPHQKNPNAFRTTQLIRDGEQRKDKNEYAGIFISAKSNKVHHWGCSPGWLWYQYLVTLLNYLCCTW